MEIAHATRDAAQQIVSCVMPWLKSGLDELIRIPSVAQPGFPRQPVLEAHDLVSELLRLAGVRHVESLILPGSAPLVVGEIPAPPRAPTVLLYSHYDVAPAGAEWLWTRPPFEPAERDGAIFGRGAAEAKSNVMTHVGAISAWEGRPPVGVRLVIEGQREAPEQTLSDYLRANPAIFQAEAVLIGDTGLVGTDVPPVALALRGGAGPGPASAAAIASIGGAWGVLPALATSARPNPFAGILPDAEILLIGTTDQSSGIRGPDERVIVDEFERAVVAEAKFFREFAVRFRDARTAHHAI
jgi:hypothetical protein